MTRRRTGGLAILTAVVALVSACGSGPAGISRYVALGDSYSAGPGLAPAATSGCLRSGSDYGALASRALHVGTYVDATCSGATTGDLTGPQDGSDGRPLNRAQFASLTSSTDLVTLGIGLNNGGVSSAILAACLPQANSAATCQTYLAQPDSVVDAAIASIVAAVRTAIDEIRRRAPHARIVLVGYPRILPDTGSCPTVLPLIGAAGDRLRRVMQALDAAYRRLAATERIDYVSTYRLSAGHDVCATHPWVNGVTVDPASGEGAALHPRPAYMTAVARAIEDLVRR